jgi:hypothetical protein
MRSQKEFIDKFGLVVSILSLIATLLASWSDITRNATAFTAWIGNGTTWLLGLILTIAVYVAGTLFIALTGVVFGTGVWGMVDTISIRQNLNIHTNKKAENATKLIGVALAIILVIINPIWYSAFFWITVLLVVFIFATHSG